jgi:hypothetical protein
LGKFAVDGFNFKAQIAFFFRSVKSPQFYSGFPYRIFFICSGGQ